MAYRNWNTSDMLSRRLFLAALQGSKSQRSQPLLASGPGTLSLADIVGLSTQDKPSSSTLEENEFYDKYKDKLNKLKANKPTEYEAAVKNIYEKKPSAQSKTQLNQPYSQDVKGASIAEKMKQTSASHGERLEKPQRPGLDSIIKIDLLQDKTTEEVSHIWSEYHASKEGVIYAVVPAEKYKRLKVKGKECPMLLCALPRESGYEFILGQCTGNDWYYTSLVTYQAHGEFAPYALAVRFYDELAESKGIVLMKGELASQDMTSDLASLLVHETQVMYGSDENFSVVAKMNNRPNEFKHMEVIDVFKKCGLF